MSKTRLDDKKHSFAFHTENKKVYKDSEKNFWIESDEDPKILEKYEYLTE